MMNIQKAVIAWAKMCETDQDRVTSDITKNCLPEAFNKFIPVNL